MKAIDTLYEGHYFRSRTEARWAVFWKTLGLPFEYESEGYYLDDGNVMYLPDYYIRAWNTYVEIKAEAPNSNEIRKCMLLHRESEKPVLLIYGQPWQGEYKALLFDDESMAQCYEEFPHRYFEGAIFGCSSCDYLMFVSEGDSGNYLKSVYENDFHHRDSAGVLYFGLGHVTTKCRSENCVEREPVFTDALREAFLAARKERFETHR